MQGARLTDTSAIHDTLSITEDLVRSDKQFFELAYSIAGGNFLTTPHNITFEGERFHSQAPVWIDMAEPNSLAMWLLYFYERALYINFNQHVYA